MSNTFKVGELLHKRSPLSKTWMNFDGSHTVDTYVTPIHYMDSEGNYQDIDTSLVKNDDGYYEAGVPFLSRFPKTFNEGYTVGDGNESLSFKPVGANPANGIIIDNKALYINAWKETNVELEVIHTGIKETIILRSDKAPKVYAFKLTGALSDDFKLGNMQLEPAWLIDAKGTYRDVKQEVINGEVVLTVDAEGLVYPIKVDPTVTVSNYAGAASIVDNQVKSASPTNVLTNPTEGWIGNTDTYRIFSRYPTLKDVIPLGSQVISASYNLKVYGSTGDNIRATAHAVTVDYEPTTLNWNNQPVMSEAIKSPTLTFNSTGQPWTSFDIKNIVQAIADGTNVYAIGVKTPSADLGGCIFNMSSYNTVSFRPHITVNFNVPPDKPTLIKPNGGEQFNALETIQWNVANDIKDTTHSPFPYARDTTFSSLTSYGQVFTIPADNAILKTAGLQFVNPYPNQAYRMVLSATKLNGPATGYIPDTTTIYATQDVIAPVGSNSVWVDMSIPNVPIPKGTRVALYVERKDGLTNTTTVGITNTYNSITEGNSIFNGEHNPNYEVMYRLTYSSGTPANQLTYQIQLTSDNGANWKTLVNATGAGASSYNYDFKDEPFSSLAKIRIRAYDGSAYGPWDESDGVFTIIHNIAPNMPSDLSPNGTIEDRATVIRLAWKHNDESGLGIDPQSKFDLQWKRAEDTNWTTVTQVTTNEFYDVPVNTFPAADIQWRVRTYDQAGLVGPYSSTALFKSSVRTTPPIVTYPTVNASIPISNPVVTWSHPSQVAYWIKVKLNTTGAVVHEVQTTGANRASTITTNLANNTEYIFEIAVKDAGGLWSTFVVIPTTVSYTEPNKPTVAITKDDINGWITLNITSAAPTGLIPVIVSYDIHRKGDSGEWVLMDQGIAPKTDRTATWIDYTATPGKLQSYKVVGYGANGTTIESIVYTSEVQIQHTQIALASNPIERVTLVKRNAGKEKSTRSSVVNEFVGRNYPMTEFGDNYQRTFDYTYKAWSFDDAMKMRGLAMSGEALLLRDNWGRKEFVTIDTIDIEETRAYHLVTFQPTKIYYVEGIL